MTNPDDLASAYLDGEVTPVERAVVEGDATVMARVEVFRSVRALLRFADPAAGAPAAGERDAAIATALATADTPPSAQPVREAAPERGDVHTLPTESRRHGDGSRRRRVLVAVGGVAASAVIAVGVVAVSRSGSAPTTGRDSSATTAAAVAPALTSAARPATAAGSPAANAPAPSPGTTAAAAAPVTPSDAGTAAAPLTDFGVLTDAVSLRAAVASSPTAVESATDPCSLAPARLTGRAQWNGIAAYVYVLDGRAVVVATAGCERLVEVPLS